MVSCKSMERFRTQQDIDYWMFNDVLKRKTSWDICWLHPLHSLLVYRCLVCRIKFSTDLNYHHFQVLLICPNWVFCSHFYLLRYQSIISWNNCDTFFISGILLSVQVNSKFTCIVNMFWIFYSFWWTLVSLLAP